MRLIDADEFKEIIFTHGDAGYRALRIDKISELIDMQSTACDTDKVVEKLEELRQNEIKLLCKHKSDTKDMQAMRGHNILQDAIEIVKSGGIE